MSDNQPTVRDAKPLFALLLGLILFLFGIAVGYMVGGKSAATPGGRGYDEGYAAAKSELQAQLQDTGVILPEEQLAQLEAQPVLSVSGTILEVGTNSIRISGTLPTFNVLSAPEEIEATVRLTDDTLIIRQRDWTQEEFEAANEKFEQDLAAYNKLLASGTSANEGVEVSPPFPPDPFTSEKISISELTVGSVVSITALEDIRNKPEFDAAQITYFEVTTPAPAEIVGDDIPTDVLLAP